MLKLRSGGRGREYTLVRGLRESLQALLFARAWPARVLDGIAAATRVTLVEHELTLSAPAARRGRDDDRPPLRLVFASDLHLGPLTPPRLLDNAFQMMADARPDVLVLGGDYVFLDVTPAMARDLERRVAAVPARTKVAVLGNHDLWTEHGLIEEALQRAGARVLVNEAVRLPAPHDEIDIVGLDEPWTGDADGARAFAASDAPVKIAVAHAPEGLPFVEGRGAGLLLCGHTHGGQIATPAGPVVVFGQLGKRWPSGLQRVGDLHLFVSRGLGSVDLPLRAYAPPDVALFTIR
jgi:predicted MPP superfamily phosphohydrolase